jgi:hypothetical protein
MWKVFYRGFSILLITSLRVFQAAKILLNFSIGEYWISNQATNRIIGNLSLFGICVGFRPLAQLNFAIVSDDGILAYLRRGLALA